MHVQNYITVFSKVANSFSAITKVKLLFPNFSTLGNENWSVQRLGAKFLYVSQITWRSTETAFSDGWVFREGQSPLKGWDSHLGMASYFSKVISCILPCLGTNYLLLLLFTKSCHLPRRCLSLMWWTSIHVS